MKKTDTIEDIDNLCIKFFDLINNETQHEEDSYKQLIILKSMARVAATHVFATQYPNGFNIFVNEMRGYIDILNEEHEQEYSIKSMGKP